MDGNGRKRLRGFPEHLVQRARDLFDGGRTASAIARELEIEFPDAPATPTERTIRNWIAEWHSDGASRWSVMSGGVEEAKAVLQTLAALFTELGPGAGRLTTAEANVLARLSQILEDMPPLARFRWARRFVAADTDAAADTLLAYLVFAPWRDRGAAYRAAFSAGKVAAMVALTPADEAWLPAERVSAVPLAGRARHSPATPWLESER